jgi:hypothetical protein
MAKSKQKKPAAKKAVKVTAKSAAGKKIAPKKLLAKGKVNGKAPLKGKPGKPLLAKGKGPAKPAAPRKPARQRVRICKQEGCNIPQTTQGFCRLHYLGNWKSLREEKAKRAQKNLDRYVERMAGQKKAPVEEGEEGATEGAKTEEAVFEEDFGEFVDVLSREENLDKILNGIKVEDY